MGFTCIFTGHIYLRKAGNVPSSHGFAILHASVKIYYGMGGNVSNLQGQLSSELCLLSASLHFLLLCSQRGDTSNDWQMVRVNFFGWLQFYQGKSLEIMWMLYFD